jgi:hypothetical protein
MGGGVRSEKLHNVVTTHPYNALALEYIFKDLAPATAMMRMPICTNFFCGRRQTPS